MVSIINEQRKYMNYVYEDIYLILIKDSLECVIMYIEYLY